MKEEKPKSILFTPVMKDGKQEEGYAKEGQGFIAPFLSFDVWKLKDDCPVKSLIFTSTETNMRSEEEVRTEIAETEALLEINDMMDLEEEPIKSYIQALTWVLGEEGTE